MNKLDQIFETTKSPAEFAKEYISYLSQLLSELSFEAIGEFANLLLDARKNGRNVYFIGNGGSAATSSHFANDLAIGTRTFEKPLKVMSLTDNNAVITAIANDDGYENIFLKQLQVLLNPGDIVVAISASGNSKNLLNAVDFAKRNGNFVVGLTGFDGGELKKVSDLVLHIETARGEYGPVEDIHMIFDHVISSYLNRVVKRN